jgi:signal transduction histidine kinase
VTLPPALEVALLALLWSGVVGVAGLLVLRWRRRRSVRGALAAVAVVGVGSLLAGVVGVARAMFLSRHDLGVVVEVGVVAAAVALVVALVAIRSVVRDVELVRSRAAQVTADLPVSQAERPRLDELAEIDAELTDASRRLSVARQRERSLEASRRELVAWVSHDLRTPLAGLRAMAEALEDGVAPDPARYHRQILREVDRLSGLVDDLFELSRIQAGTLRLALSRVDLRDVGHDVVGALGSAAASRGVALDPLLVPAGAVPVEGDAAALARIATNLVGNAVRYTQAGGTVMVEVAHRDGQAVLAVTDCCGGIPAEHRARLFEPGWRGSAARTPGADGGGGLGLAVAQGLAHAHDGTVTVADVPGGCRFELALPAR